MRQLAAAASRLVAEMIRCFERNEGYRFGETTVVSKHLHLVSSRRPGEVDVVTDADAGQVFYQRRRQGQVVHLDVFHEVGEVDHRVVARRLAAEVSRLTRDTGSPEEMEIAGGSRTLGGRRAADYIDIQTATGGGRITGSLAYGRTETLRKAHLNHVHLTLPAARPNLAAVPWLIMAAEEEIRRQGLQIRRVERVNHISGQAGSSTVDLSDYASPSDSLLREARHDWSGGAGEAAAADPGYLNAVLDLADELGGPEELTEVLAVLAKRPTWSELHRNLRNRVSLNEVLGLLEREGLLLADSGLYDLTSDGRRLHDYVVRHQREIELRFKLSLRRLPFYGTPGRRPTLPVRTARWDGRGPVCYRRVAPVEAGRWVGNLAVPETLVRALTRTLTEDASRGGARDEDGGRDRTGGPLVRREDFIVHRRRGLGPLDICLLIDASASMAGPRIRAAKYLAQHLLLSTRDRVAVVVFQEREAGLYVPFTRSFEAVRAGLSRMRPLGLTPLAEGLLQAARYVRKERARDPLLLLITDGIPTVPRWSMNPIADAITAARALAKERVRFSCIGLEPNLDFLKDLAGAARGTLHVVSELDQALLSEIAHIERQRVRPG